MNAYSFPIGSWCGVIVAYALVGCVATTSSSSEGVSHKTASQTVPQKTLFETPSPVGARPPPTKLGVRVARGGNAVVEIAHAPEKIFEWVENNLRKRSKVTFINDRIGRLEAVEGRLLYEVEITSLSTGKTGLSLTVKAGEEKRVDSVAARQLLDEWMAEIRAWPTAPVTKFRM